jgi:tetratricopeptide (TPR) repeat protein
MDKPKPTVVFFSTNPSGAAVIDTDDEQWKISKLLRRSNLSFDATPAARFSDLPTKLLCESPALVHFAMHGKRVAAGSAGSAGAESRTRSACDAADVGAAADGAAAGGVLVWRDDDGAQVDIPTEMLRKVFAALKGVRCLVLNACFSEDHVSALVDLVECVIFTTGPIPDADARAFSEGFYEALAEDKSIEAAFEFGQLRIELKNGNKTIVGLRTREGVDASRVFLTSKLAGGQAPETRHSTLPPYPPGDLFIGRAEDRDAIAKHLARPEQTDVLVLHGLPGVGKSRLAVEYALTHQERYPGGTFFVSFELTPPTDLARLLDLFHLPRGAGESLEDQCRRALEHLATRRSLLIYDNVPSEKILAGWLPPAGLVCDILATSTSADWPRRWIVHKLNPLDENDARALVENVLGDSDTERRWVDQLVKSARGITVELVAAANAIDYEVRHGRSGALGESLADETISSFRRPWSILSEDAKLVLRTAVLFESTRIPLEALRALWIGEGGEGWSKPRFNTALDGAVDRTLVAAKGEVLDMHQCVARFVREQSGPTISEAVRRRHLDGFLHAASRFCEHPADPQLAAGFRAYPAKVTFWSWVLPEDGAALDARASALGDGLLMDGRFDEARGWSERAVAQAEKGDAHGRVDSESLGKSLYAVGGCYANTGKYDEARGWYERAVAAKEKGDMHGRVDPASLGTSLQEVGICYAHTGKYDEARGWLERAVAAKEKGDMYGRVDPASLGKSLHEVGYCYASTGKYDEARGWYERAVAAKEKGDVHGRVDPASLGLSLYLVGICYSRTGKYDEARGWYERAVAQAEKGDVHGRVDPESLGKSLQEVGSCYASTGKYDEARGWYERAIAAKKKGDMHGRVDHASLTLSLDALAALDDDAAFSRTRKP